VRENACTTRDYYLKVVEGTSTGHVDFCRGKVEKVLSGISQGKEKGKERGLKRNLMDHVGKKS